MPCGPRVTRVTCHTYDVGTMCYPINLCQTHHPGHMGNMGYTSDVNNMGYLGEMGFLSHTYYAHIMA